MLTIIQSIALFLILIINTSPIVQACSCTPGARLVKDEVKRSSWVVKGTVVSIHHEAIRTKATENQPIMILDIQKVRIKINTCFKGKKKTKILTVYTGIGKGDCGFNFREQQTYIIYINKNASPFVRQKIAARRFKNTFWTDQCTRTRLSNAEELAALQQLDNKNTSYK